MQGTIKLVQPWHPLLWQAHVYCIMDNVLNMQVPKQMTSPANPAHMHIPPQNPPLWNCWSQGNTYFTNNVIPSTGCTPNPILLSEHEPTSLAPSTCTWIGCLESMVHLHFLDLLNNRLLLPATPFGWLASRISMWLPVGLADLPKNPCPIPLFQSPVVGTHASLSVLYAHWLSHQVQSHCSTHWHHPSHTSLVHTQNMHSPPCSALCAHPTDSLSPAFNCHPYLYIPWCLGWPIVAQHPATCTYGNPLACHC